jgi:hypothetical protein
MTDEMMNLRSGAGGQLPVERRYRATFAQRQVQIGGGIGSQIMFQREVDDVVIVAGLASSGKNQLAAKKASRTKPINICGLRAAKRGFHRRSPA